MLKFAFKDYKYADIAKRDILSVFSQYKDLRPTHEPFIFNDRSQKELVNLDGTIPVNYRGAVYNIPIGIFILDTHPYNPPIVYVKPTNTMQIKQGTNVDANGKVDLPYLRDWRYPQSDLLGLIQLLVIVFSEEPPVFSRTQGSQNTRPPPFAGGPTQTPYPSQAGGFPMPQPYASGYPSKGGGQTGGGYPQQSGFKGYPNYPQSDFGSSGFPGYPSQTPGYTSSPGGYPAPSTVGGGYPNYGGGGVQSESNVGSAIRPGSNQTVTEEHLRISLMSAGEDIMKRRLREIFEQAQYKHADIAKRDILDTCLQYIDFSLTHEPFIFNDGSQKELVNLDGTIPVNYRGAVYNIPIGIFILDTHPYNPPIVYVKPTNTMTIRETCNVDANGKVDLPYLQDWEYPQSDLLELIQLLVIVFSEEPPLVSRTQGSQNTRPPPYGGGYTQTPDPSEAGGFPMPQPYASGYPSQSRTRVVKKTRVVTETIYVTNTTKM